MMMTFMNLHFLVFVLFNSFKISVCKSDDSVIFRDNDAEVHALFDDNIGFNANPGFLPQRVNESDNALRPDISIINKCCPWGTYFDINTLVCTQMSSSKYVLNPSNEQIITMEVDFIKSNVQNYMDIRYYKFSTDVVPCDESMVFTSHITTQFTYDKDGPKLDGTKITGEYCIDGKNDGGTILLMCRKPNEVCNNRPCIRKCKSYGEFFGMEDEGILDLPPMTIDLYNLKTLKIDQLMTISEFGLYFGNQCGGRGRQKLSPDELPEDVYYLGTDGRLFVPNPDNHYYTNEEFCIEYVKGENFSEVSAFLCSPEPPSTLQYYLLAACFLISCVFLLATFLVYLFSPRSQNLYGKSLMCYVASLFSAYISLAVIQLTTGDMDAEGCIAAAYSTLFFFLAAFFWLNIMSIDIWKTFRSVRAARFNQSSKERIQFLWYSLYAWGMSSLLTGLCAAADFVPDFVSPNIKPDMGEESCWFSKFTKGIYVFFITPISLVIICNTVLYVNTAWRCWKIKSEIIKMGNQSRKKYTANKTQFIINSKLFIVMGIIWSLEVISFFFEHPIWYITDAANALHGVFIFVIFVLKKKVLERLPQRIRKPFIRMKNIKKKNTDESVGALEDESTAGKKFSRSSSTYVTDTRTNSHSSRKHRGLNTPNTQFPSLLSPRILEENP